MNPTKMTTEIWFGTDKKRKFFGAFDSYGINLEEVRNTLQNGAKLLLEDVTTGECLWWIVSNNIPNGTQIELLFITKCA